MGELKYMSVNQIVDSGLYPFSLGQMRHFLIQRSNNGLDEAVRRIGRRLYLRVDLFDAWINNQQETQDESN